LGCPRAGSFRSSPLRSLGCRRTSTPPSTNQLSGLTRGNRPSHMNYSHISWFLDIHLWCWTHAVLFSTPLLSYRVQLDMHRNTCTPQERHASLYTSNGANRRAHVFRRRFYLMNSNIEQKSKVKGNRREVHVHVS
jgi:hypothetical protein